MTRMSSTMALLMLVVSGCRNGDSAPKVTKPPVAKSSAPTASVAEKAQAPSEAPAASRQAERDRMVQQQMTERDVEDERVLSVMRKVPRHEFMPEEFRYRAYADAPAPIGHDQTISQPYIVAKMTELARVTKDSKVLEIGTGSGYQAAVLAELAQQVFTIEIIEPLAKSAEATLKRLGYDNVHVRHGDGYKGWPSEAPFDAIVVTAAPPKIPEPLRQQLKVGGRLVIPVGDDYQELKVVERTKSGLEESSIFPVRFVPMTGEAQHE